MLSYDIETVSEEEIERIMRRGDAALTEAVQVAGPIVDAIRLEGDAAVLRYAREYDALSSESFVIPAGAVREAPSRIPETLLSALEESVRRIERYHRSQRLDEFEYRDDCGLFGQKVVPLERVGVYAPGGTASYASSVLMAAIPAKVAGVDEVFLCTPPRDGEVDDVVLAAASLVGIEEVYAIGGAQCIAAMAYGTETVRKATKIVGPGGAIVTAAKLLVRRDCEIDFLAGPSEVLILSDDSSDPALIASEMLAQLEHDINAVALTVSTSEQVIHESKAELARIMSKAKRKELIERAADRGAIFLKVRSLEEALRVSNEFAPEHLIIDTERPEAVLRKVRTAGSVFLGRWSSVAFGDYCSGPNHVLPTGGTARSRSALSVYDFVKTVPYQQLTRKGAEKLAPVAAAMAEAEGLSAHASAARARTQGDDT